MILLAMFFSSETIKGFYDKIKGEFNEKIFETYSKHVGELVNGEQLKEFTLKILRKINLLKNSKDLSNFETLLKTIENLAINTTEIRTENV